MFSRPTLDEITEVVRIQIRHSMAAQGTLSKEVEGDRLVLSLRELNLPWLDLPVEPCLLRRRHDTKTYKISKLVNRV